MKTYNGVSQHLDPVDKELLEEKFKNVYLKIDTNHSETKLFLEKILEQTMRTNGRVTNLEEETRFVRNLTRYPKLSWLAFIGLLAILYIKDIINIIKTF